MSRFNGKKFGMSLVEAACVHLLMNGASRAKDVKRSIIKHRYGGDVNFWRGWQKSYSEYFNDRIYSYGAASPSRPGGPLYTRGTYSRGTNLMWSLTPAGFSVAVNALAKVPHLSPFLQKD